MIVDLASNSVALDYGINNDIIKHKNKVNIRCNISQGGAEMELSYMDYICYLVKQSEIAKPIYSAGLAQKVAERFAMPIKKLQWPQQLP